MIVKITNDNPPYNVVKIVDDGRFGTSDMSPRFHSTIEALRYLRGTSVDHADRGNDEVSIDFTTSRTFSYYNDCKTYCLDLRANTPRVGKVEILLTAEGGPQGKRVLEHAAISDIEAQSKGNTAIVKFTVTGGSVKKV